MSIANRLQQLAREAGYPSLDDLPIRVLIAHAAAKRATEDGQSVTAPKFTILVRGRRQQS